MRLEHGHGHTIVTGHGPVEQHILKLRTPTDIVDDHGPPCGSLAVCHDPDMRQPSFIPAQVPRDDIAGYNL